MKVSLEFDISAKEIRQMLGLPDVEQLQREVVDAIRHAAIAYSRVVNVSEEQALERIMEGFQAELDNPTDVPQPLSGDDGSVN